MGTFGGSPAKSLVRTSTAAGAFPKVASTYTSPDSAIVVPPGSLDTWFTYNAAQSQTARKAMVIYGDSTTFGSGGLYSWATRVRDRAVSAGFTDGGKGLFAGLEQELVYDSPEINGIVSSSFAGSGDGYDTLVGSWLYDQAGSTGHQHVSQFRETNLRLWYLRRGDAGEFTYSVKDASNNVLASGTVSDAFLAANPKPVFRWISGLPSGTKTLTITNTGGGSVRVAIDPVNSTGLQVQKQAMSGMTFGGMFYGQVMPAAPYTAAHDGFRFQAPLGLVPNVTISGSDYSGMSVDTSYAEAARINPCLAVTDLGFNDLGSTPTETTVYWTEYVRRFAAACRAAGVSGLVLSGQLPYNTNWVAYGAARFTAVKDEALAQGLAFADHFYPIGGPSLSYSGGTNNPHLTKAQYVTQADWLWDNLLGVS